MFINILPEGDYIVAIGADSLSVQDAIKGINPGSENEFQYVLEITKNIPLFFDDSGCF